MGIILKKKKKFLDGANVHTYKQTNEQTHKQTKTLPEIGSLTFNVFSSCDGGDR